MTEVFLIIVIVLLFDIKDTLKKYLKSENSNEEGERGRKEISYQKVLPDYLNKQCEITLKEPLVALDIVFSVKGILLDFDEEWIMLEVNTKKKTMVKMIRINNMSSITELL